MTLPVNKIHGLKFNCVKCKKAFTSAEVMKDIFDQHVTMCSGCHTVQMLSDEKKQKIIDLGNPGKPYIKLLCIPGVIGLFTSSVALFGTNPEGVVMVLMVVWIGTTMLVGAAFRRAVEALDITLDEVATVGK